MKEVFRLDLYKKSNRFSFVMMMGIVFAIVIAFPSAYPYAMAEDDSTQHHGLKSEFYTSSGPGAFDFDEKKETIVTPNINFNDLNPILEKLTGQENDVSVRWTGQIEPKYTEEYTFSMIGDNGFRLWVDDQLIIDHWVNDWDNQQVSQPISLEAGKKHDIKIEYFEDMGGANLMLEWESASQGKEIVPSDNLYVPADYTYHGPASSSISKDGKRIELNFDSDFNEIPESAVNHFTTVGDKLATSISLKEEDSSTIILNLEYPITSKDEENLWVTYDGEGQITTTDDEQLL